MEHAKEIASSGSSPLARGTFRELNRENISIRLIPARAGNISTRFFCSAVSSAHPRSRGEHVVGVVHLVDGLGSSPLARGTWTRCERPPCNHRLIPARAGNIYRLVLIRCPIPAHPRSRGEHKEHDIKEHAHRGSSPLARGTLDLFRCNICGVRLIPARAGNMPGDGQSPVRPAGSSPLARGT